MHRTFAAANDLPNLGVSALDMTHEQLMLLALAEADLAEAKDEVPIGCVIWHTPTNAIVGRGHNTREGDFDPLAHAELVAIRSAAQLLQSWRLLDCTLVVTLEPCPMCAGAIVNARLPRLVYGCADPKAGAVRTLYQICDDARLNHRVQINAGVMADECGKRLSTYFRTKRKK